MLYIDLHTFRSWSYDLDTLPRMVKLQLRYMLLFSLAMEIHLTALN